MLTGDSFNDNNPDSGAAFEQAATPQYSEFERRRTLQQLHEWMTIETVALINQDFIYRRRDSRRVKTLWGMLETIRDPNMSEQMWDANTRAIVHAIRHGDVEMLGYLFNERHTEDSEINNDAYYAKIADIAYGRAKPNLTIVD